MLSITGTVISSTIEKTNDCDPKELEELATTPFWRVIVAGVGEISLVSTKNVMVARAALRDFGV